MKNTLGQWRIEMAERGRDTRVLLDGEQISQAVAVRVQKRAGRLDTYIVLRVHDAEVTFPAVVHAIEEVNGVHHVDQAVRTIPAFDMGLRVAPEAPKDSVAALGRNQLIGIDFVRAQQAEELGDAADYCSQCGQRFEERACGPTHAAAAAERATRRAEPGFGQIRPPRSVTPPVNPPREGTASDNPANR